MSHFIVIEGCDGAGSTTQRDLVVAALRRRGADAYSTSEPTGGPAGTLIRQMIRSHGGIVPMAPVPLQHLYVTDRLDHLGAILPELRSGRIVVCDRFELSTVVYLAAGGDAADEERLVRLAFQWHRVNDVRVPDLTIVVATSPPVAAERRRARGRPEEFFEAARLQTRVAQLYAEIARVAAWSEGRYRIGENLFLIDGDGCPSEVYAAIANILARKGLIGGRTA